jgi:hypothetical protein
MEKIIMAACLMQDGIILTLPPPARHFSLGYNGEMGYITSKGRFVNRKKAKIIARKYMSQFVESGETKELYTEDLW